MKRKFLVATMAICMSGVSVLSAVGCKNDNKNANELTSSEFLKTAVSSMNNYGKTHSDYTNFEDFSFTLDGYEKLEENVDMFYTPEGGEEQMLTCVNVSEHEYHLKVDVKKINAHLFFDMETTYKTSEMEFPVWEATTAPVSPTYSKEESVNKLSFGVENDVYYVKCSSSTREGETELGEVIVEKYYKTFDGAEEYEEAILEVIQEYNGEYVGWMYYLFESSLEFQMLDNFSKYYKDGDRAVIDVNIPMITIDRYSGYCASSNYKFQFAYTENAFAYGMVKADYTTENERSSKNCQFKLNSESTLTPGANALDGYTLEESLFYYGYFGYVVPYI